MDTHSTRDIRHTHDVFISYAHLDADHDVANARLISAWLEAEGYDVWWDARIRFADLRDQLEQKVRNSRHVIVLWSRQAAKSEWVLQECGWADEQRKLAPVIIDDYPLPSEWEKKYLWVRLRSFESQRSELRAKLGPPTVIPRVESLPSAARLFVGREEELAMLRKAWRSTDCGDPAQKANVLVFHAIGGAGKTALLHEFLHPQGKERHSGAVYAWSAYSQGAGDNRVANADEFIARALIFFGHDFSEHPIVDRVERGRQLARLVSKHRTLMLLDGLEPLQDAPHINGGRLRDRGLAEFIKMLARENRGLLIITSRQELPELANFEAPQVISLELNRMNMTDGFKLLTKLGVHGYQSKIKETVETQHGHALLLNLLGAYLSSAHNGDVNQAEQFRLREVEHASADLVGDGTVPYAKRAMRIMEGTVARLPDAELTILYMVGLFDRPAEREALDELLTEPVIPGLTEPFLGLPVAQRKARWKVAVERLRYLKLLLAEEGHQPGELDAHPIVRAHFGARLKVCAPKTYCEGHRRLYDFYRYQRMPEAFRVPENYAVLALAAAFPNELTEIKRSVARGQIPPGAEDSVGPIWDDLPLAHFARAAKLIETEVFYVALGGVWSDSLEGMRPAFAAITHGCAAGRHQEAYSEVYLPGVSRGNEDYVLNKLGAPSADLSVQAHFFDTLWGIPAKGLRAGTRARILAHAAFALRWLGRFREAMEPLKAGLTADIAAHDWRNASLAAKNVAELHLILGETTEAIGAARNSVKFADKSEQLNEPWTTRVSLADILHQNGQAREALTLFEEAEAMHGKTPPNPPKFVSVWGYYYCDFLIAMGQSQPAIERTTHALKSYGEHTHFAPLDFALDHLTLGRAYALLSTFAAGGKRQRGHLDRSSQESSRSTERARSHLDDAVNGLRRAGAEEFLVRGLLVRAAFCRGHGAISAAVNDLEEAQDIASRGEMRLRLTDIHLETARLALALFADGDISRRPEVEAHTQEAAKLVNITGYSRRLAELAAIRACLNGDISASILAPDHDARGLPVWHGVAPVPPPTNGFFSRLFGRT